MPYKRSYAGYKRRPKKARSGWRPTAGKLISQISTSAVKTLKKKLGLNPESKNFDIGPSPGTTAPTLTAVLAPTAGLAQGTTNNQRNGNGLRVTHWSVKGYFNTAIGNNSNVLIRAIVTYQPTLTSAGLTVTAAQLLQTPTSINSPYNSDLEGVKIVYDKTFQLNAANVAGGLGISKFKCKINPSYDDGHVQWLDSDVGGLQAALVRGSYYLWFMTSDPNPPTYSIYSRIHYVDN